MYTIMKMTELQFVSLMLLLTLTQCLRVLSYQIGLHQLLHLSVTDRRGPSNYRLFKSHKEVK